MKHKMVPTVSKDRHKKKLTGKPCDEFILTVTFNEWVVPFALELILMSYNLFYSLWLNNQQLHFERHKKK